MHVEPGTIARYGHTLLAGIPCDGLPAPIVVVDVRFANRHTQYATSLHIDVDLQFRATDPDRFRQDEGRVRTSPKGFNGLALDRLRVAFQSLPIRCTQTSESVAAHLRHSDRSNVGSHRRV